MDARRLPLEARSDQHALASALLRRSPQALTDVGLRLFPPLPVRRAEACAARRRDRGRPRGCVPRTVPSSRRRVAGRAPDLQQRQRLPTWSTAATNQALVYIEVWSPHDRLTDLAWLSEKAYCLALDRSVILAAYLSVYAQAGDEAAACAAQCLRPATVFSHGATVSLDGEECALLTQAYYVRHRELNAESEAAMRRHYDFAVCYGDLPFDRRAVDVTTSTSAASTRRSKSRRRSRSHTRAVPARSGCAPFRSRPVCSSA